MLLRNKDVEMTISLYISRIHWPCKLCFSETITFSFSNLLMICPTR